MAFIITDPCVGTCDTACVPVCPVNCIHGPIDPVGEGAEVDEHRNDTAWLLGKQLYIDPDECIDCGACEPECPVDAIYDEDDVPEKWEKYIEINADFFKEK